MEQEVHLDMRLTYTCNTCSVCWLRIEQTVKHCIIINIYCTCMYNVHTVTEYDYSIITIPSTSH